MTGRRNADGEMTTWVCVTCGNEVFLKEAPAARVTCPRCSGRVFRLYDTPARTDSVAKDYLETTARTLDLGDIHPDTRQQDLRDLRKL